MRDRLISLAKEIQSSYASLREKAQSLRASNPDLVSVVKPISISLSVCAVDGGLLAHRMHGADIVVVRAVGVVFVYENSRLQSHRYHPQKNPPSDVEMRHSLEDHEALVFRSLVRLKHELSCAIESLEAYSPGMLLMDGSLLPLPTDRPSDESELKLLYSEVLLLYSRLYSLAKEKGCLLCGVIKDSRSRKLSKEFGGKLGGAEGGSLSCSDSLLCSYLLEEGERTTSLPYLEEKTQNASNLLNKDISSLGRHINIFYLKPSKNDIPLRVEVMVNTSENNLEVDRAASIILSLSAISENFAYPAVLVEADMCAALDANEIESIESSLISLSGMKPLRRNSRPFR